MPIIERRKIGIEPLDVDLVIAPTALSAAERQELNAFFREQRQRNDQSPAVRALRKQLAGKKTQAQAVVMSTPSLSGIGTGGYGKRVVAPARYGMAAKKAAPDAAKKAAATKKK